VAVSPDGEYSIEFVECLASCGTAPVCMLDDALHENVAPESAPELLSNLESRISNLDPHPLERRLIFQTSDAKTTPPTSIVICKTAVTRNSGRPSA